MRNQLLELRKQIEDSKCPKCHEPLDLLPCSRLHLNLHEQRMNSYQHEELVARGQVQPIAEEI